MRKFIFCSILLLVTASTFCQQAGFNASFTENDYLQKSKQQKTAAWVLLGGGFAVAVGGAILDAGSDWTKSETPYLIMIGTGCTAMVASIPLFIASGRNKRKANATAAYFEIQHTPVSTNTGFAMHAVPSLSLKLNF